MVKKAGPVAVYGKELTEAGKEARETMTLLVPHLAKKRRWSDGDCDAVRAILGWRGTHVSAWVCVGPDAEWAKQFLARIQEVFEQCMQWYSQDWVREFLLSPQMTRFDGRRPLDLLRVSADASGKDSLCEVLGCFAAERTHCGHPMVVRSGVLSTV